MSEKRFLENAEQLGLISRSERPMLMFYLRTLVPGPLIPDQIITLRRSLSQSLRANRLYQPAIKNGSVAQIPF